MNRARGNRSEVLLSGENNTYGRDKLKVRSQRLARCFDITDHQRAYALVLSGSDIISV
jgi:hypothetical protein